MTVQGFHHLAIQARDGEQAAAFYQDVLGLEEQARHFGPEGALRSIWLAVGPGGGFLAVERCEAAPSPLAAAASSGSGPGPAAPGFSLLALRIARHDREG